MGQSPLSDHISIVEQLYTKEKQNEQKRRLNEVSMAKSQHSPSKSLVSASRGSRRAPRRRRRGRRLPRVLLGESAARVDVGGALEAECAGGRAGHPATVEGRPTHARKVNERLPRLLGLPLATNEGSHHPGTQGTWVGLPRQAWTRGRRRSRRRALLHGRVDGKAEHFIDLGITKCLRGDPSSRLLGSRPSRRLSA